MAYSVGYSQCGYKSGAESCTADCSHVFCLEVNLVIVCYLFRPTHSLASAFVNGVHLQGNHLMLSLLARSSVVPSVAHLLVSLHPLRTSFQMATLGKKTRLMRIKPAWQRYLASKTFASLSLLFSILDFIGTLRRHRVLGSHAVHSE